MDIGRGGEAPGSSRGREREAATGEQASRGLPRLLIASY